MLSLISLNWLHRNLYPNNLFSLCLWSSSRWLEKDHMSLEVSIWKAVKKGTNPSVLCCKDVSNLMIVLEYSNDEVDDVAIGDRGRGISTRVVQPLWTMKMMTFLVRLIASSVDGKTCPSNDETYFVLEPFFWFGQQRKIFLKLFQWWFAFV